MDTMAEDDYLDLKKPKNICIKIWRYMDFTKFVSFLDMQSLFFCRVDLLTDKFEGSIPKYTYRNSINVNSELKEKYPKIYHRTIKIRKNREALRKCTFINSWHTSEFESAAMWSLYLKTDEGIAIQSTYKRLMACFKASNPKVYLSLVRYINYDSQHPFNTVNMPFVCKRKSFEYEKELRAIILQHPSDFAPNTSLKTPKGILINVDIEKLVEKIYVSPTAEKWFEELVRSVAKKYNINKPVVRSSLAEDPIY